MVRRAGAGEEGTGTSRAIWPFIRECSWGVAKVPVYLGLNWNKRAK